MKLEIDIKTPARQSLEGFPIIVKDKESLRNNIFLLSREKIGELTTPNGKDLTLYPGDTITIKVLKD